MNWDSFRFIDLFAGIGGIRLGFESAGGHKPLVNPVLSYEIIFNTVQRYRNNLNMTIRGLLMAYNQTRRAHKKPFRYGRACNEGG